jgi:CTP:molybdopterin cytidylyltransferase MocA
MTGRIDAVVLAGGINTIPLFPGNAPGYKALLPFAGRPALQYTLDALRATPAVGRVCVVGAAEALRPALEGYTIETVVPGGDTLLGSIRSGVAAFPEAEAVLVATADMPLITPAAVANFLAACAAVDPTAPLNLCLSLVPARCYTGAYAAFTKGFNRFRDVAVCHGNLALVTPRLFLEAGASDRLDALYDARKDPVKAALAVGLRVGLSYVLGVHLTHTLTLAQMAAVASRRFGIGLHPVLVDHPEITVDVDEPADYAFVTTQLGR